VSASSESVALRVASLIGAKDDERFKGFQNRIKHRVEIDDLLRSWIAERDMAVVLETFERAEAAIAPVMTIADIAADPHIAARRAIVEIDGVPMQSVIARLSKTPGRIRWAGRPLGIDTDEVLAELDGATPPTT
jgi:crotonobetainyl-CoA:carnitine CoA-transferase CaiB-like acyl-CoA transferase